MVKSNRTDYEQKMLRHKNRCFWTTISSRFAKRPSYGRNYHRCNILISSMNLSEISKKGSLLIIFLKLHRYTDIDVGNLRKLEYFYEYFINPRNA